MKTDRTVHHKGPLDGRVILRFAHAFEAGGGTERYLEDLDQALLYRSEVTIIRLHLTREDPPHESSTDAVGRGRLIRVPLPIRGESQAAVLTAAARVRFHARRTVRRILYQPVVWRTVGSRWFPARRVHPRGGEAIGAGTAACASFARHRVDLAMLHFFGSSDAAEVIAAARSARVPVAILNHFSNTRFLDLSVRTHTSIACAVAGVSSPHVPNYLRANFVNLADGIDVGYFDPAHARKPTDFPDAPVVLLPARIVREKGQLDLVRAVAELRRNGVNCSVVFAGRSDGSAFMAELQHEITRLDLTAQVKFLGAISVAQLRDWYASSAVVALPTRHDEGLPRVVLEAQAMGAPVVAYSSGGVSDGINSGVTGFLVRTGDHHTFTQRLREILTAPELRVQLSGNARRMACARFSLCALAERHEKFYLHAMASQARTKP